jgi:DNA-directed RNA polymerase specialized sigma24 family protein
VSADAPVTRWLEELKADRPEAAQRLWEVYYRRLVGLARRKLRGAARRAADEEDVALSAFASFCQGAREGRFAQLRDRHNLWPLLLTLTTRKAADLIQRDRRQKRGGGAVRGDSALAGPAGEGDGSAAGLDRVPAGGPTPAFAAQVADECRRLLGLLDSAELRDVAVWKMEGYTNADVAARLGCVTGTVERKLRLIRTLWEQEGVGC